MLAHTGFLSTSLVAQFSVKRSVVILLIVHIAGLGCGKVGDPLPPLSQPPPTTQTLKLSEVDDKIQLHFYLPSREITQVAIYRTCGQPTEAPQKIMIIDRDQLPGINHAKGYLIEQNPYQEGTPCTYFLRFFNAKGHISDASNQVRSSSIVAASAPLNLRCKVNPDHLQLEWDRPPSNRDKSQPVKVLGYLVNSRYRVSGEVFKDHSFSFGEANHYWVQTISSNVNPLILSLASDTLAVVPRDSFPPSVPQNVTATYRGSEVTVFWDLNQESDLAGYFVYRSIKAGSGNKISSMLPTNTFRDTSLKKGQTYRYRVSAVDESGNESPLSMDANLTIRN